MMRVFSFLLLLITCISIRRSGRNQYDCVPFIKVVEGFSMPSPGSKTTMYGIPNSSWRSSEWNWGYGNGTGHDCAAICREKFSSKKERAQFVTNLLEGNIAETDLEETKLVLALKWQRNYRSGYGEVLDTMAGAKRYEQEDNGKMLLLVDMRERFDLLNPTEEDKLAMDALMKDDTVTDIEVALRQCSGLVLKTMDFINGW